MKYKTSEQAKRASIEEYRRCILSDRPDQLAGCHIYSAGSCPELKTYSENIVPLYFRLHTSGDDTLDWVVFQQKERSKLERVSFLLENVLPEYRGKLINQLYSLVKVMASIKRFESDAEEILVLLGTYE